MGHGISQPEPRPKGVEPVPDRIFFSLLLKTLLLSFIFLTEKLPLARQQKLELTCPLRKAPC